MSKAGYRSRKSPHTSPEQIQRAIKEAIRHLKAPHEPTAVPENSNYLTREQTERVQHYLELVFGFAPATGFALTLAAMAEAARNLASDPEFDDEGLYDSHFIPSSSYPKNWLSLTRIAVDELQTSLLALDRQSAVQELMFLGSLLVVWHHQLAKRDHLRIWPLASNVQDSPPTERAATHDRQTLSAHIAPDKGSADQ